MSLPGGELLLSFIERMLADPEPLRNLHNRIASLSDLTHRVTLKLFASARTSEFFQVLVQSFDVPKALATFNARLFEAAGDQ